MPTHSRIIGSPLRGLLMAALAPVFLAACATTPPPEADPDIDPEGLELLMGAIEEAKGVQPPNTVRPGDLAGGQARSFSELLSRIPGVRVVENPDRGMQVRVRGISSITGGQEPLFILDGMVVQFDGQDIDGLDTRSIESITVLKNAGETAVYGSRGANGVIVIRTKGGGGL
jgi:TonB-dependent SusC/RagA subfamily outer membrane receptor